MTYMKKLLFALALTTSVLAQASLLSYEAGDQNLNNITLNKKASINDATGKPTATTMDLLGAGLRTKTVLAIKAKVYVAQLFSDNKAAFVRQEDQALDSLIANSKNIALKLDMLRTVSASSLVASFKDGLAANNIALDAKLNEILAQIETSADAVSGKSVALLLKIDGSASEVAYEDVNGKVIKVTGDAEMVKNILKIWLGKAADEGLATLKTQMLKPVY